MIQEKKHNIIIRFFISLWTKYKRKYLEMDVNEDINKLKWLKKDLKEGKNVDWGLVDSVEFDIEAIKTKTETIIDMQIPITELEKEVEQVCVVRT